MTFKNFKSTMYNIIDQYNSCSKFEQSISVMYICYDTVRSVSPDAQIDTIHKCDHNI